MTAPTLSRVTLQTLDNYRTAAQRAVVAYRLGGHRLVGVVNGALQTRVYPQTAKVLPLATERLDEVRDNVSGVVIKGIDQIALRTEKAIEAGSSVAAEQVTRAARLASNVDNPMVANGLQTAARLTMPGARLALVWSSKVAEGADALAQAAGARPVRRAVRKATASAKRKAAPVTRRAQSAAKAAGTKARKATATVTQKATRATKAPVARVQRTARAAKKAVGNAVAA